MATGSTLYGMLMPTVGADADVWGGYLNQTIADLDALSGAIATTGSADAYVLTTGLSLAAYATGQRFIIRPNFSNTGAATINVDGLGAKNLTKNGTTALASGDLSSSQAYVIAYDGTQFLVVGALTGLYQPLDATLTALAGLSTSASQYPRATGADAFTMDSYATVLSNIGAAADSAVVHNTGTENVGGAKTFTSALAASAGLAVTGGDTTILANPSTLATNSAGSRGMFTKNSQATPYTFVLADAGRLCVHQDGSAGSWTIPPNSSVAFPITTVIPILNPNGGGTLSILQGSGVTLRRGDGTAGSGTRTMAADSYASLVKLDTDLWYIIGVFA